MTTMSTHPRRQPMPVLNEMMQPGRYVYLPPEHLDGPVRRQRSDLFIQNMIEEDDLRRVWVGMIPDVRDLLPADIIRKARKAKRAKDQGEDRADEMFGLQAIDSLGPQRLPFPHLWIEFAVPDSQDSAALLAAYVMETDYGYGVAFFRLLPGGQISCTSLVQTVDVAADGSVITMGAKWASDDAAEVPIAEEDQLAMVHVTLPVMWAIGLMNCRNVETVEVTPAPRKTRKQRRPRKAGLSYHTIVLPAVRHSGGSSGLPLGDAAGLALHKVRGHFKTYTADAPLLGRHVGTYWWGHQVRGSKDHGEVVADYKMTS